MNSKVRRDGNVTFAKLNESKQKTTKTISTIDVMEDKYPTFVRRKVPRNRDYWRSRDLDFGSTCANHNRKIIGKDKRQLVTKNSPDCFPPRGAAFYKVRGIKFSSNQCLYLT